MNNSHQKKLIVLWEGHLNTFLAKGEEGAGILYKP